MSAPMKAMHNSQAAHRSNILSGWNILPGSNILEIGCGQGDCTTVLASIVATAGHVDAIDPAPLDYGSPWTLGEAQAQIKTSEVGSWISFHQATPLDFLIHVPEGRYDAAVFVHSSWYFSSPTELRETFAMLKGKAKKLCIAEYALSAGSKAGMPHVLAALTRASLELCNPESQANIRNAFSHKALRGMAEESGWRLASERIVVPEETLEDGKWEVGTVLGEDFLAEADGMVKEQRMRMLLESMRSAVGAAVGGLGDGEVVRTMDVWVGSFE